MENKMTEAQLQIKCVTWFYQSIHRFSYNKMLFCVNNNQSDKLPEFYRKLDGAQAAARGIVTGVSDLIFVYEGGVAFIELKLPKGVQSKDQETFMNGVQKNGSLYYIIYSLDGFIALIEKLIYNG